MAMVWERLLWDSEYVEGGCEGEGPPPNTAVDNSPGTWITNYLIGAVSLGLSILILVMRRKSPSLDSKMAIFFHFFTGLGFSIAGYMHQISTVTSDEYVLGRLAYTSILIGNAFFAYLGMKIAGWGSTRVLMPIILTCITVIVYVALTFDMLVTYIFLVFTTIVMFAICLSRRSSSGRLKPVGVGFLLAGFILQQGLASLCGAGGYSDCWKSCPLPAQSFNHNALFHTMYALGLSILGFSYTKKDEANTVVVQNNGRIVLPLNEGDCVSR